MQTTRAIVVAALAGCSFQGSTPAASDGQLATDGRAGDGGSSTPPRQRIAITIDGAKIDATLNNFPVWLDVTAPALASGARPDGSDLAITDGNDVAVPFELARWDAGTGRLRAWFRATKLTKNQDAKFYLHFGGAAAAPAQDPAAVFAAYAAVWHLDDSLGNSSAVVRDATGTAPGTPVNLTSDRQVEAKLGGGFDLDGLSMYVTFDNMITGAAPSTISAWVNQRSALGFDAIVTLGTAATSQSRFLYGVYANNDVGTGLYANDWSDAGKNIQGDGWRLLHWTLNGADGKSTVYRDGTSIGTHTFSAGLDTKGTTGAGWIGYAPAAWGTNYLYGVLDEVRIAKTALPAEWAAAEFANQSSPSTFYTIGAAEPAP